MKQKAKRMEAIKAIVSSKRVGSQSELLKELLKEGIKVTQATLSRDMKLLKVAKTATMDGHYIYKMPSEETFQRVHENAEGNQENNAAGYLSIRFTDRLAVIKTRPGYASSIAVTIDNRDITGILGTVAGFDTVFVALGEGADQEKIYQAINELFGL